MTQRLQHHALSLALSAIVTLGLLAGLDGLAGHEAASGPSAAAQAAAQAAALAAAKTAAKTLPSA